ncbi:MAG: hypothetical protein ACLFQ5_04705 [Oceanicaulis sp.]
MGFLIRVTGLAASAVALIWLVLDVALPTLNGAFETLDDEAYLRAMTGVAAGALVLALALGGAALFAPGERKRPAAVLLAAAGAVLAVLAAAPPPGLYTIAALLDSQSAITRASFSAALGWAGAALILAGLVVFVLSGPGRVARGAVVSAGLAAIGVFAATFVVGEKPDPDPLHAVTAAHISRAPTSALLPSHPWPPEAPSARARLDADLFRVNGADTTLKDVGDRLADALSEAGYAEYKFYAVDTYGIAVVTRLEGVAPDGAPLEAALRYVPPGEDAPFSITNYLLRLFVAPEGYYRYIVFIINDQPYPMADATLDEAVALSRLTDGGLTGAPDGLDAYAFHEGYEVDALIYEFRKEAGGVALLAPGRLPPLAHLDGAGLLAALEGPGAGEGGGTE